MFNIKRSMAYLKTKQKNILAALYKTGGNTVTQLAKETLINRTTLYPILEKLITKGLVSKTQMEGRTYYKAISPQDFKRWVKRKKQKANNKFSELEDWIQKQEKGSGSLISEVAYFEGVDGVASFFNDTWRDNPQKIIYGFSDYEKALSSPLTEFFINDYLPARTRKNITFRGVINSSLKAKKDLPIFKTRLQDLKFLEGLENLGVEINIYNNKLGIIDYSNEKPSAVMIKNEKIAKAFKHLFDYVWRKGKKIK